MAKQTKMASSEEVQPSNDPAGDKDYQHVYQIYRATLANRSRYQPIWDRISQFVGIDVNPDYLWGDPQSYASTQLDQFMDDPTSAISVNQAGDYLIGIMWGTGDKAFTVQPSRYVKDIVKDTKSLEPYYDFVTSQALYHMNHAEAGLNNSFMAYAYDQFAFGTSGVGCFLNANFKKGVSHNALLFRNYGVDNMTIEEGDSGSVDITFIINNWRCNRIVDEFCNNDGAKFNQKNFDALPEAIKQAWNAGQYNMFFQIVFAVMPRSNYNPKLKGKLGTKYQGLWFMESGNEARFFYKEDFKKKPIAVARQVRVRGEQWGRSSGTLLISTISAANFMLGEGIEIIEKMNKPPLAVTSNAIFGDSVLDTSSDGITVLNPALGAEKDKSIYQLFDVGDPSELLKFLLPYLEGKITTAFKVDLLLDFNSAQQMTATESLQRYAIRGKSLAGMLTQQKTELLVPLIDRAMGLLWDVGELGFLSEKIGPSGVQQLKTKGKIGRVIPPEVLQCVKAGLPWYEIKFNNELEKLVRTEAIQNLTQIIQAVGGIASIYSDIVEAVNWYQLLKEVNENLPTNYQIILTEQDFKAAVQQAQQARAQQSQGAAQASQAKDQSQTQLNLARTNEINSKTQLQPAAP